MLRNSNQYSQTFNGYSFIIYEFKDRKFKIKNKNINIGTCIEKISNIRFIYIF